MIGTYISTIDELFIIYTNLVAMMRYREIEIETAVIGDLDKFTELYQSGTNVIIIEGENRDGDLCAGAIINENTYNNQKLESLLRPIANKVSELIAVVYKDANKKTVKKYGETHEIIIFPVSYRHLIYNFAAHVTFTPCVKLSDEEKKKYLTATKTSDARYKHIYDDDPLVLWHGGQVGDLLSVRIPSQTTGYSMQPYYVVKR